MTRHLRKPAIDPQPLRFSAQEQAVVYEARQILLRHLNQNPVLSSWQAVLDYCALTIRGEVERFHVLYLDRKNRLISDECLAIGTIDQTEVIKFLGSWKSAGQVEWETLKWVDWYNNTRLHSAIGYVTPHEAEEAFYASLNAGEKAA